MDAKTQAMQDMQAEGLDITVFELDFEFEG